MIGLPDFFDRARSVDCVTWGVLDQHHQPLIDISEEAWIENAARGKEAPESQVGCDIDGYSEHCSNRYNHGPVEYNVIMLAMHIYNKKR